MYKIINKLKEEKENLKAHIHSIFDKRLKEIDNEYLASYVNMRKYPTILFVMARIMEMNNQEQNQIAMYLYNSI